MLRRDEKKKSNPWQQFILTSTLALVLAGCIVEVPAPKQFDCAGGSPEWHCRSRVTDKCIKNTYVDMEESDAAGLNQYNGT